MIVNAIYEDHSECIYNIATIFDPNTPNDIKEALKGSDKNEWRKLAESEIENFLKRGSLKKVSREEVKIKGGRKYHANGCSKLSKNSTMQ